MPYITIKESQNVTDLAVLKSKLESEEISCRFKDELSSQVLNDLPQMTVKVQAAEEDMKKVQQIMIDLGEWKEEEQTLSCPKCASDDIKIKGSFINVLAVASIFLKTIFTFSPIQSMYKNADLLCKNCGEEFRKQK